MRHCLIVDTLRRETPVTIRDIPIHSPVSGRGPPGSGLGKGMLRDTSPRAGMVDLQRFQVIVTPMKGKFSAIIEEAPEGGFWAICPEVPGANGQGETVKEAKDSLRKAIRLILADRLKDARRGLPNSAIQTFVAV